MKKLYRKTGGCGSTTNILDLISTVPTKTEDPTITEEPLKPLVPFAPSSTDLLSNTNPVYLRSHKLVSAKENNLYDDPYLKNVVGPLRADELEYCLDFYADKDLMKEFDFNPVVIAKKLTASAKAHGTQPTQFSGEIQELIVLLNQSRKELAELSNFNTKEISSHPSDFTRQNLVGRGKNGWKYALERLEKKYNVSSECTGRESITATRLALMFPQYLNFGQKPFTEPSRIYLFHDSFVKVPKFFKRPEFGGFIPRDTQLLGEEDRRAIIGVHLYALYRNNFNHGVPFRTKCVMLKRRINASLLSDERRIRFLENNEIIGINGNGNTNNGTVNDSISFSYAKIPTNFREKLRWDLF